MAYVLGLDLGTSSLKGLLFNETGKLVGEAIADHPLASPKPGFSEQNPDDWIQSADTVLNQLVLDFPEIKKELVGISFSGQMHSLVILDQEKQVIRPAILWNDVRTTKQCQEIMSRFGDRLVAITKNIAQEGFTLPKILWLQENEPENWAKVRHLMLPKDYLAYWLTGNFSTDFSDAAGTLLLDLTKNQWSEEILSEFSIPKEILPPIFDSAAEVGVLSNDLQKRYGFEQPIKVFAGGADNACAALGAGIIKEGVAMASFGTSGVFLSYESERNIDYKGELHVFCHTVTKEVYSMGVTLAAGNSLSWFRDTFAPDKDFSELLQNIGKIKPGADGLLFTPYLVGERIPYKDSQIRSSFIGIDTHHRLDHFSRAVLEGITFSLKDSQQIMKETANREFKQIVSVGGGAKNKEWLQMQADIFNAEMLVLETEQGPGMGAAMLAAVGSGLFSDFTSCVDQFVHYAKNIQPIPENVRQYEKIYPLYQKVYSHTAELCHALQSLSD